MNGLEIAAHLFLGGIALFWFGALARTLRERRRDAFRVGSADPGPTRPVSLTVIIPARNEARNIGPCLDAVLAQDLPNLQVVVLDDGSTDGTAEILAKVADPRVTVLKGGGAPLPEGWHGKPWACMRAARAALDRTDTSDDVWLLFIDADVRLAPRAASASLGYALRNDLAMLSGFGDLEMVSFWERVLQPMVAGLILAGNPLHKINDPSLRPARPLANGQFLLFRRDAYLAVGGHEAVKDDVLDDVGLASAVTAAGFAYHLVFMRALFSCRMYDSFHAVWEGWSKNLSAGLEHRVDRVIFVTLFLSLYILLPWILLVGALLGLVPWPWAGWAVGLVGIMMIARAVLDQTFERPRRHGLFMPLGAALTIGLFWNSAWLAHKGAANWKGRAVSLKRKA